MSSPSIPRFSNLLDYLASLPASLLYSLYSPSADSLPSVRAVYLSLPALAKQFIARFLCLVPDDQDKEKKPESSSHNNATSSLSFPSSDSLTVPIQCFSDWCENSSLLWAALERLNGLKILQFKSDRSIVQWNRDFLVSLRLVITGFDLHSLADSASAGLPEVPLARLEDVVSTRWTSMLYCLVGLQLNNNVDNSLFLDRLGRMGLMDSDADLDENGKGQITSAGFSFLFKPLAIQVWEFQSAFLSSFRDLQEREIALKFILSLAFQPVGKPRKSGVLSPLQRAVLLELEKFGFAYVVRPQAAEEKINANAANRKRKASSVANVNNSSELDALYQSIVGYCPTPLAASLLGGAAPSSTLNPNTSGSGTSNTGFLLVETTFKVYAFTTNPFHRALLNYFVRFDYALPGVIVGSLTKESVRNALKQNITAGDIIHFMEQYAHPLMRMTRPILPENVSDQLRLWESERNRCTFTEGFLIENFSDTNQYMELKREMLKGNRLRYANDQKRVMVVTEEGLEKIKQIRAEQKK